MCRMCTRVKKVREFTRRGPVMTTNKRLASAATPEPQTTAPGSSDATGLGRKSGKQCEDVERQCGRSLVDLGEESKTQRGGRMVRGKRTSAKLQRDRSVMNYPEQTTADNRAEQRGHY